MSNDSILWIAAACAFVYCTSAFTLWRLRHRPPGMIDFVVIPCMLAGMVSAMVAWALFFVINYEEGGSWDAWLIVSCGVFGALFTAPFAIPVIARSKERS